MPRRSKLDPFADQLAVWFSPPLQLTFAQAAERLKATHGIRVSQGTLCVFWQKHEEQKVQQSVLAGIYSGRQTCEIIDREFKKNPAPALEAIVKLLKVVVVNLSARGQQEGNEKLLSTAVDVLKQVLAVGANERDAERLKLEQEKHQRDTADLLLKHLDNQRAKAIAENPTSSHSEKIEAMGKLIYGEDW